MSNLVLPMHVIAPKLSKELVHLAIEHPENKQFVLIKLTARRMTPQPIMCSKTKFKEMLEKGNVIRYEGAIGVYHE